MHHEYFFGVPTQLTEESHVPHPTIIDSTHYETLTYSDDAILVTDESSSEYHEFILNKYFTKNNYINLDFCEAYLNFSLFYIKLKNSFSRDTFNELLLAHAIPTASYNILGTAISCYSDLLRQIVYGRLIIPSNKIRRLFAINNIILNSIDQYYNYMENWQNEYADAVTTVINTAEKRILFLESEKSLRNIIDFFDNKEERNRGNQTNFTIGVLAALALVTTVFSTVEFLFNNETLNSILFSSISIRGSICILAFALFLLFVLFLHILYKNTADSNH